MRALPCGRILWQLPLPKQSFQDESHESVGTTDRWTTDVTPWGLLGE